MSRQGTTKVLDVVQQGVVVGAVAFFVGGLAFVLVGKHDHGFTLIAVAVIFAALWLLLRLYRGRYRL